MIPHAFFPPFLGLLTLPIVVIIAAWALAIGGYAMWRAARNGDKWWFIVFLLVHTLGILELIYLLWFAKDARFAREIPAPSAPAPESSAPEA